MDRLVGLVGTDGGRRDGDDDTTSGGSALLLSPSAGAAFVTPRHLKPTKMEMIDSKNSTNKNQEEERINYRVDEDGVIVLDDDDDDDVDKVTEQARVSSSSAAAAAAAATEAPPPASPAASGSTNSPPLAAIKEENHFVPSPAPPDVEDDGKMPASTVSTAASIQVKKEETTEADAEAGEGEEDEKKGRLLVPWTVEEKHKFHKAHSYFDNCWGQIQRRMPNKTIEECKLFYHDKGPHGYTEYLESMTKSRSRTTTSPSYYSPSNGADDKDDDEEDRDNSDSNIGKAGNGRAGGCGRRKVVGPWTDQEKAALLKAYTKYGPSNWDKISKLISNGGRSPKACSAYYHSHYPKHDKPSINDDEGKDDDDDGDAMGNDGARIAKGSNGNRWTWTKKEKMAFHEAFKKHGSESRKWDKISLCVGRSPCGCSNYYSRHYPYGPSSSTNDGDDDSGDDDDDDDDADAISNDGARIAKGSSGKRWTEDEKKTLFRAVKEQELRMGKVDWDYISSRCFDGTRSPIACQKLYNKKRDENNDTTEHRQPVQKTPKGGRVWSQKEKQAFRKAFTKHGEQWDKVSRCVGRSKGACSMYYYHHYRPARQNSKKRQASNSCNETDNNPEENNVALAPNKKMKSSAPEVKSTSTCRSQRDQARKHEEEEAEGDDDEEEDITPKNNSGQKMEEESMAADEPTRILELAEWLANDVIGHNTIRASMMAYAERLVVELGYDSKEMVTAFLTPDDVNGYTWMKTGHQRAFIAWITTESN